MKFNKKTGGLLIMVLLVSISSIGSSDRFQITADENDQKNPAIYKNIVVWEDNRNGNWDIYGYDLSTNEEFQITTDENDQKNPAIYKNTVVWEDNRNGNWDIYGFDLSTNEEFQITTDENDQKNPAITTCITDNTFLDIVVWEDNRNGNWDIYGYSIFHEGEFQITTDENDQKNPAIHSYTVVWEDYRNGNWDIYGYNFDSEEEVQITTDQDDQKNPAIYNNIIVWAGLRDDWDIYGIYGRAYKFERIHKLVFGMNYQLDIGLGDQIDPAIYENTVIWTSCRKDWNICGSFLFTEQEFQITTDSNDQGYPSIYENIVIWTDDRNGYWNLYKYDFSTKIESPIIRSWRDQAYPAIYKDNVVWEESSNAIFSIDLLAREIITIGWFKGGCQSPVVYGDIVVWGDRRNGNWDIYGYDLSTKEEFQITTDENDQKNPAIHENTVVWEDCRNGNWDIYAYDLSTKEEFQITTDENDQKNPAITTYAIIDNTAINIVVWEDNRNGNWDIYAYGFFHEGKFQITADENDQKNPAIYMNIVVWEDYRNGNWDIYGHDLYEELEFCITRDSSNQIYPAIYEDTIVWTDCRNGNYDIYGNDYSGEVHTFHRHQTELFDTVYDLTMVLLIFPEIVIMFVLSGYLLYEYITRRFRSSLAWGLGFLLFNTLWSIPFKGEREFFLLAIAPALGITLLYYGIALLFFRGNSFLKEKMSFVIIFIYFIFYSYLDFYFKSNSQLFKQYVDFGYEKYSVPTIPFLERAILFIPISLLMAILFYRAFRDINFDDPFKRVFFVFSVIMVFFTIISIYTVLFYLVPINPTLLSKFFPSNIFRSLPALLTVSSIISLRPIFWVLIAYMFVIRKVTMLIWKIRVKKDTMIKWKNTEYTP